MPTKEEALQYIRALAARRTLTEDEVVGAYHEGGGVDQTLTKRVGVAEMLYYVGGGVVVLGIGILLWQNWTGLGIATKLLATLGAGVAAYVTGLVLARDEHTETMSTAFYLISALVLPIGFSVLFDHIGFDTDTPLVQTAITGALFVIYLASFFAFRKNIFTLFSILYATWLFFAVTSLLLEGNTYLAYWHFDEYRILVAGMSYLLLGYQFAQGVRASLSRFFYAFGIVAVLGSTLALGGWEPEQNIFWELAFPVLVFATLFASVRLKNSSFLIFGTLFLMGYILKITSEYFSTGLGWPLALVLAGLSMIAVGYMSFSIKNKYLAN